MRKYQSAASAPPLRSCRVLRPRAVPFIFSGEMAGDIGFDPLEISALVPIQWAREAELKHARICMLAFAGYVAVDLGFRVPFAPQVSSLYAHDAAVEKGPMLGLFFVLAFIEITTCARNARALSSPNHSRAGRTAHTLHTHTWRAEGGASNMHTASARTRRGGGGAASQQAAAAGGDGVKRTV